MLRKLVTIRKVSEILPIEGADRIVLAKIDGWQCVIGKESLKVGDLGVYMEVDSFLPIEPRFEFLRKNCLKQMADGSIGFRLRSMKLKKMLSQGLLMPLSDFPEILTAIEGDDVTELLKVKLFEPPIPAQLGGQILGYFPIHTRKTDAERIQNLLKYFTYCKEVEFEETEKLNGSSCTMYFNQGTFGVCSRNLDLIEDESNSFWKAANVLKIKEALTKLNRNISLQGELIGEGVQKNPYKLAGQFFYLFNIWDIDKQTYLPLMERKDIFAQLKLTSPDLLHVPTISEKKKVFTDFCDCPSLLSYADAPSLINPKSKREGIVFKSRELVDGEIMIFKVINNSYLLDEKD